MGGTCAKERQDWGDVKKGPEEHVFVDQMPDTLAYSKPLPRRRRENERDDMMQTLQAMQYQGGPKQPDGTDERGHNGWGSDGDDTEVEEEAKDARQAGAVADSTSTAGARVIRPYRNERAPVPGLAPAREEPGAASIPGMAEIGDALMAAGPGGADGDALRIVLPAHLSSAHVDDHAEDEALAQLVNAAEAEVSLFIAGDDNDVMRRLEAKRAEDERLQRLRRIDLMTRKYPHLVMGFRSERGKSYVTTHKHFHYNHGVARKGLSKDIRMEIARARRQKVIASEMERQLVLKFEEDEAITKALKKVQYTDTEKISAFL
jgi:hypothetical protein